MGRCAFILRQLPLIRTHQTSCWLYPLDHECACLGGFPNRLTSPFQDAVTNSVELATCYKEGKRSKAQSQIKE